MDLFEPVPEHDGNSPVMALVLLWSLEEPERIGEVVLMPNDSARGSRAFGRRCSDELDELVDLCPVQQRPGARVRQPAFVAPCVSKRQWVLKPTGNGSLSVTNVGKCKMLVNGVPAQEAVLLPGDVLEARNQLIFLVTRRSPHWPAPSLPNAFEGFEFGAADGACLVGESPAAWALRERITFAAGFDSHVFVQGQSGTGKELVAQSIHKLSSRRNHKLVSRSAATLPEGLIDAELFGNTGHYPNVGAPAREGLMGAAESGTLFFDEIGELPHELQASLLRVMDEGEYQRLGETTRRTADVRFIAATNRQEAEIKHDVLARLKLRVYVPSLGERREDIPLLARHLLRQMAKENPTLCTRFFRPAEPSGEPFLSPALVTALVRHDYTTGLREVSTLLFDALGASKDRYLTVGPRLAGTPGRDSRAPTPRGQQASPTPGAAGAPRAADLQLSRVIEVIREEASLKRAAERLDLKYRQLVHILEKNGLTLGGILRRSPEA